ncbi:MAG: HAD family phosphatase [Thermoprotei archaeon]
MTTTSNADQFPPIGFEAILFDMDGTIINNIYPFAQAKAEILATLRAHGLDVPDNIYGSIANLLEWLKHTQMGNHTRIRGEVLSILLKYDLESAGGAKLRRGVLSLLKWLKIEEYRVGLVSNSSISVVTTVLKSKRVNRFFDVVITREAVDRMKPYPDMVLLACEKLGVQPSNALVVGDSWVDVEAALAAGASTVYFNPRNTKIHLHPTYEIYKITQLPQILLGRRGALYGKATL